MLNKVTSILVKCFDSFFKGLKTASFFWTGSEVWRRHPDIFLSYRSSLNFLDRCEEVVGWFQKFEMDFVTLYYNEPDHTG